MINTSDHRRSNSLKEGHQQTCRCFVSPQIQTSIQSHAIIILPNTDGIELLVCYEDEGVYVNTYGRITKDVVLQWGEMPTSVGESHGQKLHTHTPCTFSPCVRPLQWFPTMKQCPLVTPLHILHVQICSQPCGIQQPHHWPTYSWWIKFFIKSC